MAQAKFIEIGFTALRDPATGDFLPAVPLYIEATEDAQESESAMIRDIGKVFAQKMKQYIDAGGEVPRGGKRKARKEDKA